MKKSISIGIVLCVILAFNGCAKSNYFEFRTTDVEVTGTDGTFALGTVTKGTISDGDIIAIERRGDLIKTLRVQKIIKRDKEDVTSYVDMADELDEVYIGLGDIAENDIQINDIIVAEKQDNDENIASKRAEIAKKEAEIAKEKDEDTVYYDDGTNKEITNIAAIKKKTGLPTIEEQQKLGVFMSRYGYSLDIPEYMYIRDNTTTQEYFKDVAKTFDLSTTNITEAVLKDVRIGGTTTDTPNINIGLGCSDAELNNFINDGGIDKDFEKKYRESLYKGAEITGNILEIFNLYTEKIGAYNCMLIETLIKTADGTSAPIIAVVVVGKNNLVMESAGYHNEQRKGNLEHVIKSLKIKTK